MTLKVEDFSALYTISFTALRLNPDREDDIVFTSPSIPLERGRS